MALDPAVTMENEKPLCGASSSERHERGPRFPVGAGKGELQGLLAAEEDLRLAGRGAPDEEHRGQEALEPEAEARRRNRSRD